EFARDNPMDLRCILQATAQDLPPASGKAIGLAAARLIGETFREGVERGFFVASEGYGAAEMAYGTWALVHGLVSIAGIDLGEVSAEVSAAPRRVLEEYVARLTARTRSLS
ncbi:MAG: hypothetical protein H5T84_11000, partial [Thermoleophilia bacterium]|nr:hypothetical protein [Thermoleophilia bacterium]